jgi:hypothetical protein
VNDAPDFSISIDMLGAAELNNKRAVQRRAGTLDRLLSWWCEPNRWSPFSLSCHPHESGVQRCWLRWVPAFAGMTMRGVPSVKLRVAVLPAKSGQT